MAAAADAENAVQKGLSGQILGREVGDIAIEAEGVVRASAWNKTMLT